MVGIYKITSPTGKVYIGQSIEIGRRKSYYKQMKCTRQPKIYNSLKKHGWDKHKFEIIHECQREELNKLEVYYISLFKSFNSEFGLNLQSGGDVKLQSEETKRKISLANKGRVISIESRKKLSEAHKGKILSKEVRANMSKAQNLRAPASEDTKRKVREGIRRTYADGTRNLMVSGDKNPFFGKKHSEETKKILSENAKKRMLTDDHLQKISKIAHELQKKKVLQFNLDGTFVAKYESIVSASYALGIDGSWICKVCRGKLKYAKGFLFSYEKIGFGLESGMHGRGEYGNGLYV